MSAFRPSRIASPIWNGGGRRDEEILLVLAGLWALVFLANGASKACGIAAPHLAIALGPLVIGWLLTPVLRFVPTDSLRQSPLRVYRPRP